MAKPLYIEVTTAPEGADLARTMRRHGLTAGLVRGSSGWQVEIRSPHEDPRTFLSAVGVALASWTGGDTHASAALVRRGGSAGARLRLSADAAGHA